MNDDVLRGDHRDDYRHYARANGTDSLVAAARRVAVALLVVLLAWAVLSTLFDAAKAYRSALINCNALRNQAAEYYRHPSSMCNSANAEYRVSVGPHFDRCEEAKRIMNEDPKFEALIMVLEQWKFCSAGQCMVFSMNIFDSLGLIVGTVFVVLALLAATLMFKLATMIKNNFERTNTMPSYVNALTRAVYEKQHTAHGDGRRETVPHVYESKWE